MLFLHQILEIEYDLLTSLLCFMSGSVVIIILYLFIYLFDHSLSLLFLSVAVEVSFHDDPLFFLNVIS